MELCSIIWAVAEDRRTVRRLSPMNQRSRWRMHVNRLFPMLDILITLDPDSKCTGDMFHAWAKCEAPRRSLTDTQRPRRGSCWWVVLTGYTSLAWTERDALRRIKLHDNRVDRPLRQCQVQTRRSSALDFRTPFRSALMVPSVALDACCLVRQPCGVLSRYRRSPGVCNSPH